MTNTPHIAGSVDGEFKHDQTIGTILIQPTPPLTAASERDGSCSPMICEHAQGRIQGRIPVQTTGRYHVMYFRYFDAKGDHLHSR